MKTHDRITTPMLHRLALGALAALVLLALAPAPGRFGGGRGGFGGGGRSFGGGGLRSGGGFSRGGFGGGGLRGGGLSENRFGGQAGGQFGSDRAGAQAGGGLVNRSGEAGLGDGRFSSNDRLGDRATPANRPNWDGDRGMNPDNVQTRQDGRSDRVDTRNTTARKISNNRTEAWSHSVDHWGGHYYWGNTGAAFAAGMVLGATVASLPPRYETVVVMGSPYYYYDGVYYTQSGSDYTVVPAPVGATVEHPPAQVTNVYVGDQDLGYSNGAYYEQQPPAESGGDPTYKVVQPPVGATVKSLPKDATSTEVNGTQYYTYADTWYRVFHSGSEVVYMVVADPNA